MSPREYAAYLRQHAENIQSAEYWEALAKQEFPDRTISVTVQDGKIVLRGNLTEEEKDHLMNKGMIP